MEAAGSPWVTASVACSGSRHGSVRMAVVVLKRRSELRTTEGTHKTIKKKENMGYSQCDRIMGNLRKGGSRLRSVLKLQLTHWVLVQAGHSAGPARTEWIDTGPPHWRWIPFHYRTQTKAQ